MSNCPLCSAAADLFYDDRGTLFFKCSGCRSIFRDPADELSPETEKKRYEAHNNSPADPGYRSFVDPIIKEVTRRFTPAHHGLDFGAGPVPVITELLREEGYKIEPYDPFFHNDPELLKKTYDYIAACEVIEHFRSPAKEFKLLRSLLKPGGALLCMTELYEEGNDFSKWHYKNDETHRFFYSRPALEWIRDNFGFASLEVEGRLVSWGIS
ncbi:MAG: class I SAM-dependent methyltransferase [Candidatus Margulisiibacteriota bacterium]